MAAGNGRAGGAALRAACGIAAVVPDLHAQRPTGMAETSRVRRPDVEHREGPVTARAARIAIQDHAVPAAFERAHADVLQRAIQTLADRLDVGLLADPDVAERGTPLRFGQRAQAFEFLRGQRMAEVFEIEPAGKERLDVHADRSGRAERVQDPVARVAGVEVQAVVFGHERLAELAAAEGHACGLDLQLAADEHAQRAARDHVAQAVCFEATTRRALAFAGIEPLPMVGERGPLLIHAHPPDINVAQGASPAGPPAAARIRV